MFNKVFFTRFIALAALASVFVIVSIFAHTYKIEIANVVHTGYGLGEIGFIALTALFVVFVIPLDIVFLIPIGVTLWGPIPTALMSITGWVLGATIAFYIARHWGTPTVKTLVGLKRIRAIERSIPKKNLFWSVVTLRLLISVDILSYALGIFTTMPLGAYVLATAIGVAPFGFYFAWAGTLPVTYQILAIIVALTFAVVAFIRYGVFREP